MTKLRAKRYFQRGDWAVTNYGIDHVRGDYWIQKTRLDDITNRGDGPDLYDWPVHLAGKGWVSVSDFMEVFEYSLKHHKRKPDPVIMEATRAHLASGMGRRG